MPARGPEASQRMSLAIFISAAASILSAPEAKTKSSCDASAVNLFGCERNGSPVSSAILRAARSPNSGMRVEAGADRRAADCEIVERVERLAAGAHRAVELGDVAGELLAQRQRRRILQVRAADLDDVATTPAPWHAARRAALARRAASATSPARRRCASPSETCRSTIATC